MLKKATINMKQIFKARMEPNRDTQKAATVRRANA
jgi:hypothetical protein